MLIINGIIHTMDGGTIKDGYVRTEGAHIARVGSMDGITPDSWDGLDVVDAKGGHVLPGFLDIHCHLGLYGGRGEGDPADDLNEAPEPVTPQIRALDAINPMDRYFEEARKAGVTTVLTGPGSANPIAGQSVLMKTAGTVIDDMILKAPAAMKFALGENPKRSRGKDHTPATRMATASLIRETLTKAADYGLNRDTARSDPLGSLPDTDMKLEALVPVISGKLQAHFHAHRADDIVTAVRISREFGMDCVIVHGTEGHLIADWLAKEGIPVITGPSLIDHCKPELANATLANAAILSKAGVQVAICTDHPETPIQLLPFCAAMAAHAGLDEEDALAAITISAACIVGLEDRLGSITPGKDADLVIMDGHPFHWRSHVTHVFIDGKEV